MQISIEQNEENMKKKKEKNKNAEVKITETKVEETKVEETKVEEIKTEETKTEEAKVEEPKEEEPKEEKPEKVSIWKKIFNGEYIKQALVMSGYLMLIELFFHVSEKIRMSGRFAYPILFSLPIAFLLTALFSLLPRLANRILSTIVISITAIWTCVQICYASLFGTYMEINKLTMAGDVAESFGDEMKSVIFGNMTKILHVITFAVIASLILFLKIKIERENWKISLIGIGAAVLLQLVCYGALFLGGQGPYSPINMYKQFPRILDNNMQNFGIVTSFRMDLVDIIIGREATSADEAFKQDDMSILLGGTVATSTPIPTKAATPTAIPDSTSTPVPTMGETNQEGDVTVTPTANLKPTGTPTPEPTPKTRNVLDIDFAKLIAEEKDENLKALHQYISTQPGTAVNEYTGYFKGYNLIMICAESFTSYMIDEKITPTLYKMANNGFVFNNYYGTFYSVTTNGEYAFCTGLMPNTVGKTNELKTNSTFMLSADKYLPYCMGNVFKSLGASTFAYHSHTGSYYDRASTHPNMGYEIVRFTDGTYTNGVFSSDEKLKYSIKGYPNSDEETVLQTMKDYLGNKDENGNVKPFHAYYMTYSGHHPYYDKDEETQYKKNPMVYENREIVDSLNCSDHVKGYIAANLELENMMTQLLKGLEEAGCLENTVIVLTNDHYPYGLTDSEFKELGKMTTGKNPPHTFGFYENAFICYNAGMQTPVVVDTPCCTVDIVPTLLNLFGVDYDSRLLAGTDVLDPTSFHVAMLYNQTFITDKVRYDTKWGQIQYIAKKSTVSDEYINACVNYVKNKFEISLQVITNDYYRVIYDFLERNK